MAEIVGLTASVMTLSKLAKLAIDVYHLLKDAPSDLRQASQEVVYLSYQIPVIKEIRKTQSGACSNDAVSRNTLYFDQALEQVELGLERFANNLNALALVKSKRKIIRWALLKREQTQRLLNDLNSTRLNLITILELQSRIDAMNGIVLHKQFHNRNQLPRIPDNSCALNTSTSSICDTEDDGLSDCSSDPSWQTETRGPYLSPYLNMLFTMEQHKRYTIYEASFLLRLPFSYALTASFVAHCSATTFPSLRNSSLVMRNFVPSDCDFLTACLEGRVEKMQHMLQRRLASPNDITAYGQTPTSMAIKGGNVNAVRLLLDEGVNVNTPFGTYQTSYLSLAIRLRHAKIARLLLQYGACCQSVSGYGWSPMFYLWTQGIDDPIAESSASFIELLAAQSGFHISYRDILDVGGLGLIHRASILGQPQDVEALMKVGVNPFMTQGPLQWTAIQNAVYYNRHDVFKALLPKYQSHNYDINTPDTRGWTLLHISASEGHDSITRHLLDLGANWQVRSKPYYSDMAEELFGGRWTPAEVALGEGGKNDGPRRQNLFRSAVKDILGIDVPQTRLIAIVDECDAEDEESEVWSDAPEEILTS